VKRGIAGFAVVVMWWSAIVLAGAHKVLVLPIDGDADPALRKQLTAVVVALAKSEGGDVATGDTTFAETAAAIGCDPHAPGCAEEVRKGLNVDEIVFGSAFTGGGQTTAVISKVVKGQPQKDQTVSIAAHQKADTAEPVLRPLFGGVAPEGTKPGAGSGSAIAATTATTTTTTTTATDAGSASELGSGSGSGVVATAEPTAAPVAPPAAEPHDAFFSTPERKLGFGLAAGGGLVFVIGLALWSSESGLQDQINSAPDSTSAQITTLRNLEDRASTKAWEGNVLVVVGLAAAGVGTYYLIKDHQMRATVAPVDRGGGAAVVLGGRW